MKLKIGARVMGDGRHHIVLLDEAGEPLPRQIRTEISDAITRLGTITVEFGIDGKNVSYEESMPIVDAAALR